MRSQVHGALPRGNKLNFLSFEFLFYLFLLQLLGKSFLRVCDIAVCDFHFFHLTLQIETDFIFSHV